MERWRYKSNKYHRKCNIKKSETWKETQSYGIPSAITTEAQRHHLRSTRIHFRGVWKSRHKPMLVISVILTSVKTKISLPAYQWHKTKLHKEVGLLPRDSQKSANSELSGANSESASGWEQKPMARFYTCADDKINDLRPSEQNRHHEGSKKTCSSSNFIFKSDVVLFMLVNALFMAIKHNFWSLC